MGGGAVGVSGGKDPHLSLNTFNPGKSAPTWEQDYHNPRLLPQRAVRTVFQAHRTPLLLPTELFPGLLGWLMNGHVDLPFSQFLLQGRCVQVLAR